MKKTLKTIVAASLITSHASAGMWDYITDTAKLKADRMNKRVERLYGHYEDGQLLNFSAQQEKATQMIGTAVLGGLATWYLHWNIITKDKAISKMDLDKNSELAKIQSANKTELALAEDALVRAQHEEKFAMARSVTRAQQKAQLAAVTNEINQTNALIAENAVSKTPNAETALKLQQKVQSLNHLADHIKSSSLIKEVDRAQLVRTAADNVRIASEKVVAVRTAGETQVNHILEKYVGKAEALQVKYRAWKRMTRFTGRVTGRAWLYVELAARTMFFTAYNEYNPEIFPGLNIVLDIRNYSYDDQIAEAAVDLAIEEEQARAMAKNIVDGKVTTKDIVESGVKEDEVAVETPQENPEATVNPNAVEKGEVRKVESNENGIHTD